MQPKKSWVKYQPKYAMQVQKMDEGDFILHLQDCEDPYTGTVILSLTERELFELAEQLVFALKEAKEAKKAKVEKP